MIDMQCVPVGNIITIPSRSYSILDRLIEQRHTGFAGTTLKVSDTFLETPCIRCLRLIGGDSAVFSSLERCVLFVESPENFCSLRDSNSVDT